MFVTSGITFSMHYCGGEYVSTSVNKEASSCCDDSGGCCENKTIHLEVEDDYVNSFQLHPSKDLGSKLLFPVLFCFYFELPKKEALTLYVFQDTSSPPGLQVRLSLLQSYLC